MTLNLLTRRGFPSARRLLVPLAVVLPLALASSANAGLLLYEGFDYGATAGSLVGKDGGAGWAGGWGTPYGSGSGSQSYQTGGLTFSNLVVAGGNAFVAAGQGQKYFAISRQHSAGAGGTVWGSYLYQQVHDDGNKALHSLLAGRSSAITDNTSDFAATADEYETQLGGTRLFNGAAKVKNSGTATDDSQTTYLVLFKVDGLGLTGSPQSITEWILTEAQFANFKLDGTLTEGELNGAGLGKAATKVLQRGTSSLASGSARFAANDYTALYSYAHSAAGASAMYDEIRISDTSLNEVAPTAASSGPLIPEPVTLVLGGLGMAGLGGYLRRRRTA